MSANHRIRSKRSYQSGHQYLDAAESLDQRIAKVKEQLRFKIEDAIGSVERDIAIANRDRVILGLSNLLGSEYKILRGLHLYTVEKMRKI